LRSNAQAQLNSVRKQIGSIDAGIAALKSADASLDKYQGDLGKSKNKGGGGGGNKDAKSKDPNQDELDRYQLVNVQLKEISKELSKLEKQKSKLFGGKLIENLNKQVKILNDQITVTERKLAIAQQEQDEIAATLLGYGISFDSDGNIANYAQVFAQQQANLNAVYATYNSMSADAQDAYEDTVKAAEES
jgi:DNA repair exonuclease SbcCD ATPase subunit